MDKLKENAHLRDRCVELVDTWLLDPGQQSVRRTLDQWREMLTDWSVEKIRQLVLDETKGQVLRQCSPLGPLLTPRERWVLLDEVNQLTTSANRDPS